MPYTQEQESQFREEWARRTTKQKVAGAAFFVFLVGWVLQGRLFPQLLPPLPAGARFLIFGSIAFTIVWLLRRQSRCPACNVIINARMKVTFCPSCGVKLG